MASAAWSMARTGAEALTVERVAIAGPYPLYRGALRDLLPAPARFRCVELEDPSVIHSTLNEAIDLLVICPGLVEAPLLQTLADQPRLTARRILLLSDYCGQRHRRLQARGRIDDCLPLAIDPGTLKRYLQVLCHGRTNLPHPTSPNDPALQRAFRPDIGDLTPSERRVLFNLQLGLSDAGIAQRLNIQLNTVKVHLARTYRKAGFRNRYQAAGYACCHSQTHPTWR